MSAGAGPVGCDEGGCSDTARADRIGGVADPVELSARGRAFLETGGMRLETLSSGKRRTAESS